MTWHPDLQPGISGDGMGADRAMLIEPMNALKEILEATITQAVKNKKKTI